MILASRKLLSFLKGPLEADAESHRTAGGWPALCLDFFYSSVEGEELEFMKAERRGESSDKLVILTCVDKDTGMIRVVPLPSKDGIALQYAAKEVLSFLSYLGRTEAEIRGDNEMQNLVTRIATARASVGLATRPSPTQPYEHQTNGPAEQSIQSVREIGATLLQQLKQSGYVLSNESDVVGWAYVHASMVRNTFAVCPLHWEIGLLRGNGLLCSWEPSCT